MPEIGGRPSLTPGAEPIVTAARFAAGATKVPHGDDGVRRRDAAARDGQGRGLGGDESERPRRDGGSNTRPP